MINAAEHLVGLELGDGWTVTEPVGRHPEDTGGNFSVNYQVEDREGRRAFLKALNLAWAARQADPAAALQSMTSAFNFERDLLARCRDRRMDHVVTALTDGTVTVPGDAMFPTVNYLIFEEADGGDIRGYLRTSGVFDLAFSYRTLHHVAVALHQLHSVGIAHQDLKPSNVLVFGGAGVSKVADLGRASAKDRAGPFDDLPIPGDQAYAPPELLYREVPADWNARRQASDLYQLGSLLLFLFTDLGSTAALLSHLHPDHTHHNWAGSFEGVLPFLDQAFERVIEDLEEQVPHDLKLRDRTLNAFRQLAVPDPRLRGHPSSRRGLGSNYAVERYVSLFDLLARTAEQSLTRRGV